MKNNLIYDIHDKPKKISEWLLYALQQLLSVFVATVLISQVCGTPSDACLVGAGIGTIIYQVITGFNSPMFISSCGATVSAVIGALAIGDGNNYLAVVIGGLIILAVYGLFALLVKLKGIKLLNKLFPPVIVGSVTMVIGLNLAAFIPTYTSLNSVHSNASIIVALITMLTIAISSHYFKGFLKTIPFLIGLAVGYMVSAVLTLTKVAPLIDFSIFNNLTFFNVPDFSFMHLDFTSLSWGVIGKVCLLFTPVALCGMMEHYSDHNVLSNIIGTDLTKNPGLHRTLLGDGLASFVGTIICGLPNTSYGESIATVGFSKVASTKILTLTAVMLALLAFISPLQAFITSIPACVFGGCAMILYGYIFASGLKTIISSKIDLNNNKDLIIMSVIITIGVSGIWLFTSSFAGVSLSMIIGLLLNLILKDKKEIGQMRKFEKVSYNNSGILPTRSDTRSAGYDIYTPEALDIPAHSIVKFKTNIKASMESDEVLLLFVRSSIGIKKNLVLCNGTGVVDSSYYNNPDNEGNIMCALYNYGETDQHIDAGDRVMQGIFVKYMVTDNDCTINNIRTGGIGSSGK